MARVCWEATETLGRKVCVVTCAACGLVLPALRSQAQQLPNAPSFLLVHAEEAAGSPAAGPDSAANLDDDPLAAAHLNGQSGATQLQGMEQKAPALPAPCVSLQKSVATQSTATSGSAAAPDQTVMVERCENPVQLIVTERSRPLTSREKGILAIKDIADPFNILVLTAGAGFSIAASPHSAYGPGLRGWGKLTGYSFVEDAQGEFIGTYMISSLTHEDPRYHRMPQASIKRRMAHALIHTLWTQHDNGSPMLNYETLLTYPASAELSNLYVPGVQTDAKSTARRIAIGLATDPVSDLIAEFLPDFAKRIHVRVVFMQQILNQVANGAPAVMQ